MKPLAIILILLCIVAVAGTGYLFMTANLRISGTGCVAADALDWQDTFRVLKEGVDSGTFTGTLFHGIDTEDPSGYQFYTYIIRLKNDTFLPAKTVEIQITPMDGDILQIGDLTRHNLAARSVGDFQATLLTAKNMHNVREITVTWYFWGLPFSAKTTYNH